MPTTSLYLLLCCGCADRLLPVAKETYRLPLERMVLFDDRMAELVRLKDKQVVARAVWLEWLLGSL